MAVVKNNQAKKVNLRRGNPNQAGSGFDEAFWKYSSPGKLKQDACIKKLR